jgi:hypothetical protein
MLSRVNIWRFKVLGGDNQHVTTADGGGGSITVKGPPNKAELLKAAAILLNSRRSEAMRAGLDDPGYHIDEASIEPLGHTDDDIGSWVPEGAKMLELPTDAAVRADKEKFLATKLGGENV